MGNNIGAGDTKSKKVDTEVDKKVDNEVDKKVDNEVDKKVDNMLLARIFQKFLFDLDSDSHTLTETEIEYLKKEVSIETLPNYMVVERKEANKILQSKPPNGITPMNWLVRPSTVTENKNCTYIAISIFCDMGNKQIIHYLLEKTPNHGYTIMTGDTGHYTRSGYFPTFFEALSVVLLETKKTPALNTTLSEWGVYVDKPGEIDSLAPEPPILPTHCLIDDELRDEICEWEQE